MVPSINTIKVINIPRRANSGGSWEPSSQKLSWMAEIICQKSRTFFVNCKDLAKFTHFCRKLIIIRVSRVFSVSFSHKNVIKKLTTMSKNPAFSQKVLKDWLRLPERQELFAGLGGGLDQV